MVINKMLINRASAWLFLIFVIIWFFQIQLILATLPPLVYGHQFAKK